MIQTNRLLMVTFICIKYINVDSRYIEIRVRRVEEKIIILVY